MTLPLPIGTMRDSSGRSDSGTVSRGDWVRYVDGNNKEFRLQVDTAGSSPLSATLDLVGVTWDVLGIATLLSLKAVPSCLTAGGSPYWTP